MLAGVEPPLAEERLSDWSHEVELLAGIFDRLGSLTANFIKANGGGDVHLDPYPRPVSAMQKLRVQTGRTAHERLVARLLRR